MNLKLCSVLFMTALLTATSVFAYPLIDTPVATGTYPVKVYADSEVQGMYWYIPISIDPWTRDNRYESSLYMNQKRDVLSFVFRGQASVDENTLKGVARALGVSVDHLTPIAYDYSKDLFCENIYANDPNVQWVFPKQIGNYLEIVPVSLRATGADLVDEISTHIQNGGLACVVSVGFKAVSTGYKVEMTADLNTVYERFEADVHAEGFWWEVDIHTLLEKLRSEGVISIRSLEDTSIPQSELDKKIQASMDQVTSKIIEMLFVQKLQLPTEPMAGRGKPWSLRMDYRRTEENKHYRTDLTADKIQVKDSQIGLRIALQ
jgi:hypothetical protein